MQIQKNIFRNQFYLRVGKMPLFYNISTMEVQLLKKDNYKLSYVTYGQGINLILKKLNNKQCEQIYQGQIPSIDTEYLTHFFENTEELIDHMKIEEHIQINTQNMTVKVVSWVNTKKIKKIQIFQVNLHLLSTITQDRISQIIKFCSNQPEVNNNFLKRSIKVLAEVIYSMMNEKQRIRISPIQDFKSKKINHNLSQKFTQFKEEIYSLLIQKAPIKKDQPILQSSSYQHLDDRIRKLENRYDMQYQKIANEIKQLSVKVSEQLNQKVEELSKIFVTFQETQAIINKMKILAEDFQRIQEGKIIKTEDKKDKKDDKTEKTDKTDKKDKKASNPPNFRLVQPFLSKFKVMDNIIQYVGENKTNTHYLLNRQIPYKQNYSFKIKIVKTGKQPYYIYIGIADYQSEKNQRFSSYQTSFFYCRNSVAKGFKYPSCIEEGNGFGQGDIVEVNINLSNKNIKWVVNGKQEAQESNDKLGVKKTIFIPFVQFCYTNSAIELIEY